MQGAKRKEGERHISISREESKKPPEDQPPPSRHPRRKAELESAEARHSDAIAKDCEESTAGVNTKIF